MASSRSSRIILPGSKSFLNTALAGTRLTEILAHSIFSAFERIGKVNHFRAVCMETAIVATSNRNV